MVSMATSLHCGVTKDAYNQEAQLCQGISFRLFVPGFCAPDPGSTSASPAHLSLPAVTPKGREAHDGMLLRFYDYCYSQQSLFDPCYTLLATVVFPVNSHQKGELVIAVHP